MGLVGVYGLGFRGITGFGHQGLVIVRHRICFGSHGTLQGVQGSHYASGGDSLKLNLLGPLGCIRFYGVHWGSPFGAVEGPLVQFRCFIWQHFAQKISEVTIVAHRLTGHMLCYLKLRHCFVIATLADDIFILPTCWMGR